MTSTHTQQEATTMTEHLTDEQRDLVERGCARPLGNPLAESLVRGFRHTYPCGCISVMHIEDGLLISDLFGTCEAWDWRSKARAEQAARGEA